MSEVHIWSKFSSHFHLQCLAPHCGGGLECTRGQHHSFHMQTHQEIWSSKDQAPSSCPTVQGAADAKAALATPHPLPASALGAAGTSMDVPCPEPSGVPMFYVGVLTWLLSTRDFAHHEAGRAFVAFTCSPDIWKELFCWVLLQPWAHLLAGLVTPVILPEARSWEMFCKSHRLSPSITICLFA